MSMSYWVILKLYENDYLKINLEDNCHTCYRNILIKMNKFIGSAKTIITFKKKRLYPSKKY